MIINNSRFFFINSHFFFQIRQINFEAITQYKMPGGLGNYLDYESSNDCPTACPETCTSNYCWNNKQCQVFDTGKSTILREYINETTTKSVYLFFFFFFFGMMWESLDEKTVSFYIMRLNMFDYVLGMNRKKILLFN